jgi:UTP:GlnB (protein PII) uridylyltransferase
VRTLLDRQRDHIRYRRANGEPFDEIAHAQTRLLDNTVIGLCHLGQRRLDQPVSIMPPLVVIARGDYGRQRLGLDANADLLVLLAADRSDHEQAVQLGGFVARELATLGWRVSLTMHTTCGHVSGACLDRAIASDLCAGRIVCGCEALIFELQTGLQEGALDPRTQTNRGMPEHLHALPLAA